MVEPAVNTLQQQAKALGDPTRHAIFRYIADADAEGDVDVDVAQLTADAGVNHNAVRQHLAKLVEAGLVVEGQRRGGGRGRPKLVYRIAPSAESRWGVPGPYERLSHLLAEIVRTGDTPVDVGRRSFERRAGTETVADGDPVALLVDEMDRAGFQPTARRSDDHAVVSLGVCPFASTAATDPDTVCDLHLGMALAIADATEGLVIDELVRRDPHRAGCRLRCHVEPAGAGVDA